MMLTVLLEHAFRTHFVQVQHMPFDRGDIEESDEYIKESDECPPTTIWGRFLATIF